jgi:uncharacterized protein (TIGR03437 family)
VLLYADEAMRKLAAAALLFTAGLGAQTADVAYFRAVMLPSNEVPATDAKATGSADIIAHMIRDDKGQIVSGTVEFFLHVNFTAPDDPTKTITATGLHIHRGDSTVSGPVVINTGLSAGNNQVLKPGGDVVHRNAPVLATDSTALTALRDLMANPGGFYVNIHTTDFPGGAIRGQLVPAVARVLIGQMAAANEVPAVNLNASGNALVLALAAVDPKTGQASGATYMQTTYNIPEQGNFTGFHIHLGAAGTNGPVVINSAIPSSTTIDSSGSGLVGPFFTEIDMTNSVMVQTFTNLFVNPQADYINIHTNLHTGGVMRAQLRAADTMTFPITLDSANEVGTVNYKGTAPSLITLHTLRNEDGSVATGSVFFDINCQFSGATAFTGLHIHDAGRGVNGPVTVPAIPTYTPNVATDTGVGNIFVYTPALTNVATLSDIIENPENHYANIHSTADPGGSARAQLGPIISAAPAVAAAISADLDKTATTVAPGGLISIFGTNLVKTAVGLDGWLGTSIPRSLNGTSVTIGGKATPIIYVSQNQINAQVPVDVPVGPAQVVVTSTVGPSASFPVTVAATAPAIFFAPSAAVLKNSDFSLVSATNPVKAGDVILVYCTGLGQTTPAMSTGSLVPATGTAATNAAVTATIGGKDATVVYAIASPGFVGLYQVAITVPTGATGKADIVLKQGSTPSNAVSIPVQ